MPAVNLYTRNRDEEEIRPAVTATGSWWLAANNNTANLNGYHPISWNTTQWFPDNDTGETARQMMENVYNNMTARDVMEMAEATPESMLRLVRLNMPNINTELTEEQPMDLPNDYWGARTISMTTRVDYFPYNEDAEYSEYSRYNSRNNMFSHKKFVYKNGRLKVIKRYCKI